MPEGLIDKEGCLNQWTPRLPMKSPDRRNRLGPPPAGRTNRTNEPALAIVRPGRAGISMGSDHPICVESGDRQDRRVSDHRIDESGDLRAGIGKPQAWHEGHLTMGQVLDAQFGSEERRPIHNM